MVIRFVEQLFEEGRIRLRDSAPAAASDIQEAVAWVIKAEVALREHLPLTPPMVNSKAIEWAVIMFYSAAQLAVFRQLGEDEVERRLRVPSPALSPSVAYSVDLVFRFLPDMLRLAKAMNPDDPLVSRLRDWSREWPLSSVGVGDIGEINVEVIVSDGCLRQLYIDRIIEAEDLHRLGDPRVAELVRGALGAYPELSPKLQHCLAKADETSPPTLTE